MGPPTGRAGRALCRAGVGVRPSVLDAVRTTGPSELGGAHPELCREEPGGLAAPEPPTELAKLALSPARCSGAACDARARDVGSNLTPQGDRLRPVFCVRCCAEPGVARTVAIRDDRDSSGFSLREQLGGVRRPWKHFQALAPCMRLALLLCRVTGADTEAQRGQGLPGVTRAEETESPGSNSGGGDAGPALSEGLRAVCLN